MRRLPLLGLTTNLLQAITISNRLAPILFLLQDMNQARQRDFHVIGLLHQLLKQRLGPIKQTGPQIVFAQLQQG